MRSQGARRKPLIPVLVVLLSAAIAPVAFAAEQPSVMEHMVLVPGGVFNMGDVFAEGNKNETPVHEVELSDFYIGKFEVTVAQYNTFVDETGYLTRAERFDSREKQQDRYDRLVAKAMAGERDEEFKTLAAEFLESGGCHFWQPDPGRFDFSVDCNWRTPLVDQTDNDPVVCLAWVDAASYCNWLSAKEGLPPAYDVDTGELLDEAGKPTDDVTAVRGYRLPTEAEWEYAAREGGKEVRFGNGSNTARAEEINFDAARGDYPFSVEGEYSGGTTPVASYPANALGLFDMSGNAWEWCSDFYAGYAAEARSDLATNSGAAKILRGGRFGGDAKEARVFTRTPYESINRCNASGFRLAKSR